MDRPPAHPFPYFGLLVTRDAAAIKAAVEAKYAAVAPLRNHPMRVREFGTFNADADLITRRVLSRAGAFESDPDKVEAVIRRVLPLVEEYLLGLVNWNAHAIRPEQVEKCVEVGEKVFGVAASVARPNIEQLLRGRGHVLDAGPAALADCDQ